MCNLNDWKSISHNFDDTSIWNRRKMALNIQNDVEFESYIHSLKNKNSSEKELDFLSKLLESNYNSAKENERSKIDDYSDPFIFAISCLSDNLWDYYIAEFEKYFPPHIKKSQGLENLIYSQIQKKVYSFLGPTIRFEYKVYLKAYEIEDNLNSKITFINETTNSEEWISYYFESYPVSLSIITSFSEYFKINVECVLKRLSNDWKIITDKFKVQDIVFLDGIFFFLGDPHKSWQTTTLFRFSDSKKQIHDIYYKPKNLAGEIFFNNFIKYVNSLGIEESVLTTENINMQTYGWQKGLKYTEFNDPDKFSRFFYHQGINLAFAYILNIQDLIADNILVCNDYPVYFDLELIFLPEIKDGLDYITKSKAGKEFLSSVIKTGLVPSFGFENANNAGFSNSGISKVSDNTYKVAIIGNDKEIFEERQIKHEDKNLPIFNNKIITVDNYCNEFENGFRKACSFIIQNRYKIQDFIIKSKENISEIQTRVLIRFTYCYSEVLRESYTPKYMSGFYEYYRLLDFFWRGYNKTFLPEQIVQSEINQLAEGVVPYFLTYPTSTDLYDGQNHLLVKDFFKSPGYDFVLEKIKKLDNDIIREQVNIIRRAFYIHNDYDVDIEYKQPLKQLPVKNIDFLLHEIGDFLLQLNREDKNEKYFSNIDYTISKDDLWSQGIQNCDIFQGTEGLAIFFTALYSTYKEEEYLIAAKNIFNQSMELFQQNRNMLLDNTKTKIGVANFPVSTFYFSLLGNRILQRNYFNIEEEDFSFFLDYAEEKYQSDNHYCYFSGSTGLLLLLIEYYILNKYPRIYDLIVQIGKYLVDSSIELKNGTITWEKPVFNKWGGFVHGNSSIAYALFKLAKLTNNETFLQTAIKALEYDQSLFDETKQIWRKSVDFEGDIHHSWGNGSAGIGLSRLLISNYYSNEFSKQEIKIAIQNIDKSFSSMMDHDHSVCSGLLGMIEIRKLLDSSFNYEKIINDYVRNINSLDDIRCGGWEKNPLVTGLFYGFSGIGYNLLKLTRTDKFFPSLLWL